MVELELGFFNRLVPCESLSLYLLSLFLMHVFSFKIFVLFVYWES